MVLANPLKLKTGAADECAAGGGHGFGPANAVEIELVRKIDGVKP